MTERTPKHQAMSDEEATAVGFGILGCVGCPVLVALLVAAGLLWRFTQWVFA